MEFLIKLWNEVVRRAEGATRPAILYSDLDLLLRTVRDLFTPDVDKLDRRLKREYERLQKFVAALHAGLRRRSSSSTRGTSRSSTAYGIENEIDRALERKVWLQSGG